MTGKMRKAYDRQATAPLSGRSKEFGKRAPIKLEPLSLSIIQALEWAFAVEMAHLDFDDSGEEAHGGGWDTIAVLMERGVLGCKVDGGGRSRPSSDAEVIVEALSQLPIACGGQAMAVQIAGYARAGGRPDWMQGAVPKVVPQAWAHGNQHGRDAATQFLRFEAVQERGRKVEHEVRCCPVTWAPSAVTIASARRHYLQWWSALLHLRADLVSGRRLERVTLTKAMPPLKPWAA